MADGRMRQWSRALPSAAGTCPPQLGWQLRPATCPNSGAAGRDSTGRVAAPPHAPTQVQQGGSPQAGGQLRNMPKRRCSREGRSPLDHDLKEGDLAGIGAPDPGLVLRPGTAAGKGRHALVGYWLPELQASLRCCARCRAQSARRPPGGHSGAAGGKHRSTAREAAAHPGRHAIALCGEGNHLRGIHLDVVVAHERRHCVDVGIAVSREALACGS